jgi:hypothetical protein
VARVVSIRGVGRILSAVRQGLTVGAEYGAGAVEALVWVAESVEESVLAAESFVQDAGGLRFVLSNPPLRTGAFVALRIVLDGRAVAADRIRLRPGPGTAWRTAGDVGAERPLRLGPGIGTEVEIDGPPGPPRRAHRVRLELECAAIPPLVWLEFEEVPREVERR